MVTSLFEYKSCKNYSKRMKTISSIIQRNWKIKDYKLMGNLILMDILIIDLESII